MRSDRNGSCDANSRLRAFNVCYRPACPEGGFRCWGRGRRQRADCRHGPGEAFQQAPDTSSDCAPSSCTAGHCFYDVQSSARRSARGAGNHRLRSEFLPQDIRRNFAIPLLPPSCGSPIFSACREPRPQDSVCFAGRASRPQAPDPSAVRPFEPWCPTPGFATLALAQVPHRRCERCRRSPISERPQMRVGGGKVRAANS